MKKFLLIISLVLTFSLVGCTEGPTEKEVFADKYGLESAEHVFDTISLDEVEDVVAAEEKAIVYFGSPI